jgi:hypothetical protein
MTLAIILVVAAALALIFILSITVSRSLQVSNTSLAGRIQPLDLEAFRNLTDAAEDEYLRRRLRPADFRSVRRERLRAMAAYVQVAGRNATLLVRIGQSALTANDPHTVALLKIYVALAWPNSGFAAKRIVLGYQQLSGSAMLLGRLQNPAVPVRISASL